MQSAVKYERLSLYVLHRFKCYQIYPPPFLLLFKSLLVNEL